MEESAPTTGGTGLGERFPNIDFLVDCLNVGDLELSTALEHCMRYCNYPIPSGHELMDDVCRDFDKWLRYQREILEPLKDKYLRGELDWQLKEARVKAAAEAFQEGGDPHWIWDPESDEWVYTGPKPIRTWLKLNYSALTFWILVLVFLLVITFPPEFR